MTILETRLRLRRDSGRKLLMPYLTGGVTPDWTDHLRALADAGADAIEVGIPFSDPTLDGVTIQEASDVALARGATTAGILADLSRSRIEVPVVVSTYANLALRGGADRFCRALAEAGVRGLIVPDLPLEEAGSTGAAARAANVDLALLASPATPPRRLREIAERSRGFVYAVSLMGITGEREHLATSAAGLARRLRGVTDRPVFLGFGISTPAQAAAAARDADGVIVGAALMRRLLDGADPAATAGFVRSLRAALDGVPAAAPADAGG
ncbi:tryptophan synthase subunit alpha [Micromonospora andamanensis]|uniref:Tryptophan synthase alpha chain n=1 Tax=Micromonospora andamanensis TaxID=1287068 RepID=A0ABQ4HVG9_9ACTN|nr:tryptophan synthase subunit alpha [Micromonospora andamanensis]GIJ09627.1 tryptophan synthase alpha chain [Micromonospora andamanensis]